MPQEYPPCQNPRAYRSPTICLKTSGMFKRKMLFFRNYVILNNSLKLAGIKKPDSNFGALIRLSSLRRQEPNARKNSTKLKRHWLIFFLINQNTILWVQYFNRNQMEKRAKQALKTTQKTVYKVLKENFNFFSKSENLVLFASDKII